MSNYTPQNSGFTPVDPRIISFFEAFYATSDDPSEAAHDAYADSLTPDATLIMGTKRAEGREQIYALRKGLWSGPVKTRKHHVHRLYPFAAATGDTPAEHSNDVMLHGSVDYILHNGVYVSVSWAGHACFIEDDKKELKMRFYQVYLDSAPVAEAAKEEGLSK